MNGLEKDDENRKKLRIEIFFIYVKMRRHLGTNKRYTLIYTSKEQTLLENFLKILEDNYELNSLGGDFFLDYFLFHFCFWSDVKKGKSNKTSRSGIWDTSIPMLNWIVGKKGFERWKNKKDNWKFWVRKNGITIPNDLLFAKNTLESLTKKINVKMANDKVYVNFKPEHFELLNDFEEQDKELFHNTEFGLVNCSQNTSLYNRKSSWCVKCRSAKKCKLMLRELYPEIAKLRMI